MSGYLSGSTSLSVTNTCWSKINNKAYYGDKATASATVSVSAGSNTASYSITVTTTDFNFIQIYLKVGDTVVKNEKDSSGKKTYSYSGTVNISGGSIAVRLGVGCSQYDESVMSFTDDTLSRTYWSDGSAPSLTITDNGNNTATMSGYLGSSGSNNGITGSTLYWTTNGMLPNGGSWYTTSESMGATSGGWYSKTISIPSNCSTIWAITYCSFSHNTTYTDNTSASVKYYTNPGNPGKPVISYTKSRLTIKENWTFSWGAASAGNSNSPVRGYRIRLYKNGTLVPIKDYANGRTLSSYGDGDYWYDRESTSCSIIIDPVKQGFLPGDKIQLGVFAYTKNGDGDWLWSGWGTNQITSDIYTVQNAGIVQVRTASGWHEGQVWVRTASGWHEAETVQVRAASGWHESE